MYHANQYGTAIKLVNQFSLCMQPDGVETHVSVLQDRAFASSASKTTGHTLAYIVLATTFRTHTPCHMQLCTCQLATVTTSAVCRCGRLCRTCSSMCTVKHQACTSVCAWLGDGLRTTCLILKSRHKDTPQGQQVILWTGRGHAQPMVTCTTLSSMLLGSSTSLVKK